MPTGTECIQRRAGFEPIGCADVRPAKRIANVEMVSEMALDHMGADVRNAREVAAIEGNQQESVNVSPLTASAPSPMPQ